MKSWDQIHSKASVPVPALDRLNLLPVGVLTTTSQSTRDPLRFSILHDDFLYEQPPDTSAPRFGVGQALSKGLGET